MPQPHDDLGVADLRACVEDPCNDTPYDSEDTAGPQSVAHPSIWIVLLLPFGIVLYPSLSVLLPPTISAQVQVVGWVTFL